MVERGFMGATERREQIYGDSFYSHAWRVCLHRPRVVSADLASSSRVVSVSRFFDLPVQPDTNRVVGCNRSTHPTPPASPQTNPHNRTSQQNNERSTQCHDPSLSSPANGRTYPSKRLRASPPGGGMTDSKSRAGVITSTPGGGMTQNMWPTASPFCPNTTSGCTRSLTTCKARRAATTHWMLATATSCQTLFGVTATQKASTSAPPKKLKIPHGWPHSSV